ncbi:MAG: SWIM zinc finger family protein [Caldilineaceae bacterium]|nr:SWIM zinc finger family protein [Caldilineaceae bacterium]
MRRYGRDEYGPDEYGPDDFDAPRKPRKTDAGLKARRRRGDFVEHWWAERWIESLERITNAGRLRRGRSYARGGQVLSIEESQGQIQARVQGSRAQPYRVTLRLQPLSDRQWQAVVKALSERAIFSAQLLAGEMPHEIEEAFAAAGVALLPASSAELETGCSCPDWANPCKHVAAVHYILGEQFDEDPFLIFRLRGRSQEQIMAALAARREAERAPALAEAPAPYTAAEAAPPLEETLATFWQMGQALEHFPTAIQPPAQPYPILRRLGPASFAENLERELGPMYDAMARAAQRAAFAGGAADAGTGTEPETDAV